MDGSKCKDCRYCDHRKFNAGKWYCQSPKVSIFSLPVDTEKCFEPKKQEKYCSTCHYYTEDVGVCVNGDSEHCADFRCLDDTCEEWKQKGE